MTRAPGLDHDVGDREVQTRSIGVMDGGGLGGSVPRKAVTNAQRGAAVGGIALAVGSVFVTFGASIVAMLAIWVASVVGKRRQRPLTRGVGWVIGVGSVGVVALGVFVLLVATQVPPSEISKVRQAMDSAAAAPQRPLPEWLRKITPPNAQRPSPVVDSVVRSRAFTVWTMVMGFVFFAAVIGAYAGSLGWVASMLLTYGATGAWLPRSVPDPSLSSAPAPLPRRA